jgi:hypothetical protein
MRARVAILTVGFVLAACGRAPTAPIAPALPTPPDDALVGLRALSASELGPNEVAADAVDAEQLGTLLEEAGFESAVGRAYSRPRGPIRRVDVRVVRFATPAGAERYLAWLEGHADDVIGAAETVSAPTDSTTALFLHLQGGCCPHDQATALAAWRDGRDVVRVIVSGPGADETTVPGYVSSVERWWATS